MQDAGRAELIFVLVLMFFIMVFGIIAVSIFYRVWRKEQREAARPRRPGASNENGHSPGGKRAD